MKQENGYGFIAKFWKEENKSDVFGRRIARDKDLMPMSMQYMFTVSFILDKYSIMLAGLLAITSFFLMFTVISDSYFMFGKTLISQHELTKYLLPSGVAIVFVGWILPTLIRAFVLQWYYKARVNFKKSTP